MALDNMRILRLEAENVKRIRVVDITPTGDVVTIAGRNGQGKTSVLDAILWALGGERPIQWKPIREGEAKAHIQLDLGDDDGLKLQVTRRFASKEDGGFTTTLKVVNAEGFRPDGEQTLLNTFVGKLSFDPTTFIRAKPDEQVAILKGLVPGFDFDEADERRAKIFARRTDVTREAKRLESAAAAIAATEPAVPTDTEPPVPIDTEPLMVELANAGEVATVRATAEGARQRFAETAASMRRTAERNDREAEALIAKAAEWREAAAESLRAAAAAEKALEEAPPLPELVDTTDVRARLEAAQDNNRKAERAAEKARLVREAAIEQKVGEELTREIAAIDEAAALAVERAELPVRGLSLGDGMVMLRGVPFAQASDAEQLRASLALAIAANPKLRVIRIRDGSLLDPDALAVIREVAHEERFQIWMERISTDEPDAIIMEAGEVKGATP